MKTYNWLPLLIALMISFLIVKTCRAEVAEVVLQTIAMESANQPFDGQVAVASVILNRARIGHTRPQDVVLRPKQFSCWNDKKHAQIWLRTHFDARTRNMALSAYNKALMSNKWPNLTHYHVLTIKPYWAKGHEPSIVIGDHAFYEDIP